MIIGCSKLKIRFIKQAKRTHKLDVNYYELIKQIVEDTDTKT